MHVTVRRKWKLVEFRPDYEVRLSKKRVDRAPNPKTFSNSNVDFSSVAYM
jgi:hypothetical protein